MGNSLVPIFVIQIPRGFESIAVHLNSNDHTNKPSSQASIASSLNPLTSPEKKKSQLCKCMHFSLSFSAAVHSATENVDERDYTPPRSRPRPRRLYDAEEPAAPADVTRITRAIAYYVQRALGPRPACCSIPCAPRNCFSKVRLQSANWLRPLLAFFRRVKHFSRGENGESWAQPDFCRRERWEVGIFIVGGSCWVRNEFVWYEDFGFEGSVRFVHWKCWMIRGEKDFLVYDQGILGIYWWLN